MVYPLHRQGGWVPAASKSKGEEHSLRSLAQPRKRGPLSLEQPKRIIAWEAKAGPKGGRPKASALPSCLPFAALQGRQDPP